MKNGVLLQAANHAFDVLVTADGCDVITLETPKSVADIEALVGKA